MNERDPDLDKILSKLREAKPSAKQISKWQTAVARERNKKGIFADFYWQALQVAAALAIGVLFGSYYFTKPNAPVAASGPIIVQQLSSNWEEPNATIEHVYAKSN
jgi:hypothetical protein